MYRINYSHMGNRTSLGFRLAHRVSMMPRIPEWSARRIDEARQAHQAASMASGLACLRRIYKQDN